MQIHEYLIEYLLLAVKKEDTKSVRRRKFTTLVCESSNIGTAWRHHNEEVSGLNPGRTNLGKYSLLLLALLALWSEFRCSGTHT